MGYPAVRLLLTHRQDPDEHEAVATETGRVLVASWPDIDSREMLPMFAIPIIGKAWAGSRFRIDSLAEQCAIAVGCRVE